MTGVLLSASLCLLVSSVAIGGPPGERFFDQVVAEAGEARRAGDYRRTIALLKEAYGIRPEPALLNNMGAMFREMGHYEEALNHFSLLLKERNLPRKFRRKVAQKRDAMKAKLGRAWLRVNLKPSGSKVYVDGQEWLRLSSENERGLDPGEHVLEVVHPHFAHVYLLYVRLTMNRRAEIDADLSQLLTVGGQLSLIGHRRGIESLSINEYVLQSTLQSKQGVCLPAGSYRVRIKENDRPVRQSTVMLGSNHRVPIGSLLRGEAAVGPNPKPSSPWTYVMMGTGVAVVGVGTWLWIDAAGREDDLKARLGEKNANNAVTGITANEAASDQESINTRNTWATVSVVTGSALIAGGVTWWLIDWLGDEEPERAVHIQVHPTGVMFEGRF